MDSSIGQFTAAAAQILNNISLKYAGVGANENLLAQAIASNPEVIKDPGAIRRLVARVEHQFIPNTEWTTAFEALYASTPEAWGLRCDANERVLEAAYRAKHPYCNVITDIESLAALLTDPSVVRQLTYSAEFVAAQQAEHEQRAAMSAEAGDKARKILDLTAYLFGPDGEPKGRTPYDKRVTQARIDKETSELSGLSTEELNERHAQWAYKKKLEGMSADDVRAVVRGNDAQRLASCSRFVELPAEYFPIGRDVGVPWTERLLRTLPSTETARLAKLYGYDQLTKAIQKNAALGRK